MALPVAAMAATTIIGVLATMMQGHHRFAPGACERLEPFLLSHIVGQDLAIRQFSDATCDLIRREQPGRKPLIISAHGPPGVGKSLTHWLAAKALYNTNPAADDRCPGHACAGYKVMYGMDYVSAEREEQHTYLRAALLDHLKRCRQSLLVIEEYDKLDCPTRAMFRQLFDNLHTANITSARPIVLLESNTGYTQLHQMLEQAGDRAKVDTEEAQRTLKDLIFGLWSDSGCEERAETLKMVGMIDFFLPYLPLERQHIRKLFGMRLQDESDDLYKAHQTRLAWDETVIDFLVSKVDFEGAYAIEGAKEVSTVMTRHVSRSLRLWHAALQQQPDTLAAHRKQSVEQFKSAARQLWLRAGLPGVHTAEGQQQQYEGAQHMLLLGLAPDRRTLTLEERT